MEPSLNAKLTRYAVAFYELPEIAIGETLAIHGSQSEESVCLSFDITHGKRLRQDRCRRHKAHEENCEGIQTESGSTKHVAP
jgi:hypothetical protein